MKQFTTVLKFELTNYIKNKTYMLTTILMAVILGAMMFLPHFIDMGNDTDTPAKIEQSAQQEDLDQSSEENESVDFQETKYMIFDPDQIIDNTLLKVYFPGIAWQKAENDQQVRKAIENKEAKAGFCVEAQNQFTYYILNKDMDNNDPAVFTKLLGVIKQMEYCKQKKLNFEEVTQIFQFENEVQHKEEILGKDMMSNYFYCYIFVILIFMMIIMYGAMIATSVTTEKSNRSIEVLVTSTSANSLIFGKVIAGAIAGICQMGIILGSILISYQINRTGWNGMLDQYLNIPENVLIIFALFGIGGYLFYAFLYGAVGALVSKTEDINKSAGGLQMIIMIVYFVVLAQLSNVDGIVMKIASFLPFSSYSAMFTRAAMGAVELWEVIVSFLILAASVVVAGLIGAKIYRMGTLRYGNPIKFSQALKDIFRKE
ncbi:MAG: ABC transporter permease [Clostridiales bacterium]|nr:ABC transporter permease [Clostridiales bacterium]